jgi:SAM-dependent methyltransferase
MFPDLNPELDDLFLLEAHEIADLPVRVPERELGAVLHAHPRLHRFLVTRCPAVTEQLAVLVAKYGPHGVDDLAPSEKAVVWEVADLIVYQRAPEYYETHAGVDWTIEAVSEAVPLQDKVVIDAGAGTGRVTFDVAPAARHVFAVETVATLRRFMRDKAADLQRDNVFVLDGFLHAIPLPAASADVLLTCQAVGWALPGEMAEIERVVKPGGVAMHLFGRPGAARSDTPLFQALQAYGYQRRTYQDGTMAIRCYSKTIGA